MINLIPWVGGKGKLLWLIHTLAPRNYSRFIDVFAGGGTVTLNHPIIPGCMQVYNDYNSNLTNLFQCTKERPLALVKELSFLPLDARDEFNVLTKFLSREEFTSDYLKEELELAERFLPPPDADTVRKLLLERAELNDVQRAAAYFKQSRYSFSGNTKSFGGKPCDIRRFFYQIWECSRRLKDVLVENRDFEDAIRQYDREDAFIYCDPPYYQAECYVVEFPEADHFRLHALLSKCKGFVMVSYNYCPFICELYKDFYIFYTKRPNSMSQTAGSEYEEVVMTNYDPRPFAAERTEQFTLFPSEDDESGTDRRYALIHEPKKQNYFRRITQ